MNIKLTAALLAAAFAASSGAAPADFTVNGKKITAEQQEQAIQALTAQGAPAGPQLEQLVKQSLTQQTVLVQAAEKAKLQNDKVVASAIEQARQGVLADAAIRKHMKAHPVTEAEIKAEYDREKAAYGKTEYYVSHILLATEAEAEKALARLKNGEDFAKVAKEVSQDPGSKENGGCLEWSTPSQMVQPFGDAMKSQKVGEISSKPVKTQFGYHIVKVEKTRPAEMFPAFERQKMNIEQMLSKQRVKAYIDGLVKEATIK